MKLHNAICKKIVNEYKKQRVYDRPPPATQGDLCYAIVNIHHDDEPPIPLLQQEKAACRVVCRLFVFFILVVLFKFHSWQLLQRGVMIPLSRVFSMQCI